MEKETHTPHDANLYFSNPANCRKYVVDRRSPNGVVCPRCQSAARRERLPDKR